jgi:hypothetical protein
LLVPAADGQEIKKFKAEVISGAITFTPRLNKTRQLVQNITAEQDVSTRRNQDELATSAQLYLGNTPPTTFEGLDEATKVFWDAKHRVQ